MSVNLRNIVLFGIKIDYDKARGHFTQEQWDTMKEWTSKDGANVVGLFSDGMSGEYFYIGEVLAVSNDYQNGMVDFNPQVEVDVEDLLGNGEPHYSDPNDEDVAHGRVSMAIIEKWPELKEYAKPDDYRLHIFSHYT